MGLVALLACPAVLPCPPPTFLIHRFTAASDIAAEIRAETKAQPPIPFRIGGVVRADLTPPYLPLMCSQEEQGPKPATEDGGPRDRK